tara:strand:- start:4354 stop:4569 length:216 start_codon:yes stop_codon:yes gene_type:complete
MIDKEGRLDKLKATLPSMSKEELIEIVKFLMDEYEDLVDLLKTVSTHANLLKEMSKGLDNVVGVVVMEEEQ